MTNSGSERPGEFELIAEMFAPLATAPGALRLNDDAAVIEPTAGHDLVITTDTVVESVHFFARDPPDLIAKKALRVNLSDLAAKGAAPAGYLLALSLSSRTGMSWLRAFAQGLAEDQDTFGVSLYGGDTTATPGPLTISVTAFGHVPEGKMSTRSGARLGDLVFVSGSIGDAGGGLACLKREGAWLSMADSRYLVDRYQVPQPRVGLGRALLGIASASVDVSDGLLADLGHIAQASSVLVRIEAARIPLSPALKALWGSGDEAVVKAASAGDDYELAFTAPAQNRERVTQAAAAARIAVTEIGRCEAGRGVALLDEHGKEISPSRQGYVHF